ncbi:hypothetical protein AB0K09_16555, partial [Streptomyces sp. NPDC049577]|uniref:hypothetical protein n=1 Tax=Streptomyces sp. NPDC049577 TaxID=3155153 RepID=UPI00341382B6
RPARPASPRRPAYRSSLKALSKPQAHGTSLVTFTLVLTAPAILAAALLRPRGGGRGGRRGR